MSGLTLLVLSFACVLGGILLGWLWGTTRARTRATIQLAASDRARIVAETQVAELRRGLDERQLLLEASKSKLTDSFRALAAEALAANNEGFLTLAAEKMASVRQESDGALQARQQAIENIIKPMKDSLEKVDSKIQELEVERARAYGRLSQQVTTLSATHDRLTTETGNLARALRAPSVRGRWGEIQLKRVVELAGMIEHCDFGQQVTLSKEDGQVRPDVVVKLPGGRQVVVDAKVPMEAYLDAIEATDDNVRGTRLAAHAQQVKAHVVKLSSKAYWAQLPSTPDFVVMFLPSEAMYSAALEQLPSLIEEGVGRKVLLATPTTLIALLQSVYFGWREERLAENAQEISEQGKLLHERVATMVEHWGRMGGALQKATEHFNAATGSYEERVRPAARRLQELGAGSKKAIQVVPQIEVRPRLVAATADKDSPVPTRAQHSQTPSNS